MRYTSGAALPYLKCFSDRVASIDSQAYGVAACRDAYRRRISKSDGLVADHMERWLRAQLLRLSGPGRSLASVPVSVSPREFHDPWDAVLARARAEIRALIACGELDHDAITQAWVEQWAADIAEADAKGERGEEGEADQMSAMCRRPS